MQKIDIDGIMAENDDLEKGRIKGISEKQRKRILKNLLKKKMMIKIPKKKSQRSR